MKALSFFRDRPVAVSMAFLALILLGVVSAFRIPVALLPDIPVGKIIVKTIDGNYSSRRLEDEVGQHLRLQLMQTSKIEDIKSKTYDGLNIIELSFPFGTDMEMALIDVNEQIDKVLSKLPRSLDRPTIMQIGASDIPIFYLNLKFKNDNHSSGSGIAKFAKDVVRRRLEQLQGVGFVDVSGLTEDDIVIIPDVDKMRMLDMKFEDISRALKESVFKNTSVNLVRNEFEYNLIFPSIIKEVDDIKKVIIKKNGKSILLKDICSVVKRQKRAKGFCLLNGEPVISMAIIRQDGSRLGDLHDEIERVIAEVKESNPKLEFEIVNDQSKLLDITISNLVITLITGALLAIMIVFLFIRNRRLPFLIGLSIPISLLISILFFHLLNLSINIISLSGLILGIGMMIDNAIIVVDNISRKYKESLNLSAAVVEGGSEVFSPLLSSVLTTTCIFIPLIFLSGISGALFYDQAVAVAVGLFVSLAVSIILIPVYYKLLKPQLDKKNSTVSLWFEKFYEVGFSIANRNQKMLAVSCIVLIVGSILSLIYIKHENIPAITRLNAMVHIDWNQPITADENYKRVSKLGVYIKEYTNQQMAWIGRQQYFLQHIKEQNTREVRYFLSFDNIKNRDKTSLLIQEWLTKNYPDAVLEKEIVPNLFDYIFSDDEPELALRLYYDEPAIATPINFSNILNSLEILTAPKKGITLPIQEQLGFVLDPVKLELMDIKPESLMNELQSLLQPTLITSIYEGIEIRDVVYHNNRDITNNWVDGIFVHNNDNKAIPLNKLGKKKKYVDWSIIYADKEGEYLPYELMNIENPSIIIDKAKELMNSKIGWHLGVSGSFLTKNKLLKEMIIVLLVSLLLLYFILAAQFESLSQPLIILLEIPIDIVGATLMLYLFDSSLNILSMIGIIVVAGIVINDSILKIDTINKLVKQGLSVQDSIHKAGQIRLRPILMTSFTTILALCPFLFGTNLGNEIQKPLALAIIGGLGLGTIVSLFFLPFFYKWLNNFTITMRQLVSKNR